MTTTEPGPEPRYVTTADLEVFEGRVINRLNAMELRLVRDLHDMQRHQFGWAIGLLLPIYALLFALLVFLYKP